MFAVGKGCRHSGPRRCASSGWDSRFAPRPRAVVGVQRCGRHAHAHLDEPVLFWIREISLAWLLSGPVGPAAHGIVVAVAFSTLAVVSVIAFRTARWKTKQV